MTKEKAIAYAEVYQILQYLSEEEYRLISKDKIKYIKDNMDINAKKICTMDMDIHDIKMSEEAQKILLSLFYTDVANERQRRGLEIFLNKKEQENLIKYDENKIFNRGNSSYRNENIENNEHENSSDKALVVIDEKSIRYKIKKIVNRILEKIGIRKNR